MAVALSRLIFLHHRLPHLLPKGGLGLKSFSLLDCICAVGGCSVKPLAIWAMLSFANKLGLSSLAKKSVPLHRVNTVLFVSCWLLGS